jgi:hypothetical protein
METRVVEVIRSARFQSTRVIPVHSSDDAEPCRLGSLVTTLPFRGIISAPAMVFRTPIIPSWPTRESERHNSAGSRNRLHFPARMSCAMGRMPDVT